MPAQQSVSCMTSAAVLLALLLHTALLGADCDDVLYHS